MTVISVHQAKKQLAHLVERAAAGEEILIARAGQPVAKLVPFPDESSVRSPGGWEGRLVIHEEFDRLPTEVVAAFR